MNEYNSGSSGNGGKSSDQIKADIERTRSEMTEKIDTIQERLSPDNLKVQAQTMVQDIMQESADAITDFLKTSAQSAGQTLVETIKNNPLPSAVVGVGLGWLLMNTMNSQRGESDDRSRGYGGYAGGQRGYQSNIGYGQGGYGQGGYSQGGYSQGGYGQGDYGRGMGQGSMIGARASYTGDYGYEEWQESDVQYNDNQGGGLAEKAGDVAGKVGRTAKDVAGNVAGTVGGAAQNIAGSVAGAVQGAAGAVQDAAGNVAGSVSGAAQNIAGKVGDTAGSTAQSAADMGQQARHQAMSAGRQVTRQAGNLAGQAGNLAGQTQYQAARAGRTVQRSLEDNPVAFGAAALLAGIAVGLALPATRQERQLFGDARDQVMDKAQSMASSLTEQAKQVVAEVRPQLEETAQKVVEDLKASGSLTADELLRTGKQAGEEIKQTLKETGTTVKSRVEDTTGIKLNVGSEGSEGESQDSGSEIASGLVAEGTESQPKPNTGGSYDSKFDAKS